MGEASGERCDFVYWGVVVGEGGWDGGEVECSSWRGFHGGGGRGGLGGGGIIGCACAGGRGGEGEGVVVLSDVVVVVVIVGRGVEVDFVLDLGKDFVGFFGHGFVVRVVLIVVLVVVCEGAVVWLGSEFRQEHLDSVFVVFDYTITSVIVGNGMQINVFFAILVLVFEKDVFLEV